MIGLAALLVATLLLGCDDAPEPEAAPARSPSPVIEPLEPWSEAWLLAEGERYLEDADHRRASMLASLRNHDNLYSRTRIASYGRVDRGWDRLPEWNPRTRAFSASDRAALESGGAVPAAGDVDRLWDGVRPTDLAEWTALGREVFFRYPLRADPDIAFGLRERARAAAAGIEEAEDGTVPGVVVFADLDGRDRIGITCALCHTATSGGAPVEGRARRRLDYGQLQLAHARARGRTLDPELARRMASWGPGRADITEDDSEDPVAIPDLWGLRHQSSLTQAGTIEHIGPIALALRQETQYLYANHHRSRPPRVLVWALTMYLYSLEPPPRDGPEAPPRGRALFAEHCADCHSNEAWGGQPVRAERVGTHGGLARGVARGTGRYRPAALVRVGEAAPYFHHGAVATLDDVLSRRRLDAGYEGPLGVGPVVGHEYGFDLPDGDRAALVRFLETL